MKVDSHRILIRPLLTEKLTALREATNTVGFVVHPDANRIQIRLAVEALLKVKVDKVNVMNVRGKVKKLGRFSGRRSDWKKALVTLKQGEKLEMYESA
ncbi:MAG: 50S ribosomal protein L23 [Nitrospira sp.]|jgi:large subunit ribosomal protein L23|nr:50S ribosomal protein L23 [Nitrospira sp.]MDH4250043.1 50S ribosomal protein L23 [Nitrospira sp.]MDH4341491.1 50S ribosomal protein L23 [Nitrospira sp.]MDH5335100.1 50S ribosomal protein L23 [Nitrospira sp.]